jgi:signal transduction histidine kinase
MLRSSEVMARLVDDLLTFAQFERGDVVVRREPLAVESFLKAAITGAARLPGGERLRLEPGDPGLVVSADPVRLRQVMSNLLSNALRYAPGGPVAVRYAAEGDAVRIEVADKGPGVGADEQARVWERFYRGRSVAGIAGERATGIGLAVVKALVEAQGGAVGLESPPTGGATFWLTLPAAVPVQVRAVAAAAGR